MCTNVLLPMRVCPLVVRLRQSVVVSDRETTALDLCDVAYIMDMGRIVRTGSGEKLLADPIIREAYLGVLDN